VELKKVALSLWAGHIEVVQPVGRCGEGYVAGTHCTEHESYDVCNLTPWIVSKCVEVFRMLPVSHDIKGKASTMSIFIIGR
jgi:hypothetical protein